jgi:hypothetical protein
MKMLTIGFILGALLLAGTGRAHRLSGHPRTVAGQLALAKAQARHDRLSKASGHWLRLDRAYVRKLRLKLRPPHFTAWLCIHRGEGSWSDPNPPFYGGLQMDYGFQATYGRGLLRVKGTADHWTPLEQMWVAERAYRARGFYPWPNTARACGLI